MTSDYWQQGPISRRRIGTQSRFRAAFLPDHSADRNRGPNWALMLVFGIALILGPAISAASGADYYFSDCATGGQGTQAAPWCLDPNSDGNRESIMFLFDGKPPEASPGDNIFLCAGLCDGSGKATYHPDRSGANPWWFRANTSGTSTLPITIRNFPGETVIITGDADGNGVYSPGDIDNLITNSGLTGIYNIHWIATDVPGNGIERNRGLVFEKSGGRMVMLDGTGGQAGRTDGPNGWLFQGIVFRYSGAPMWSGQTSLPISFYQSGCDPGQVGAAMMKVAGLGGDFTVRNCVLHSACGFLHRNTNNDGGGGHFLFEDNEYYNSNATSSDFLNINAANHNLYATFVWRGNYIHDVGSGPTPKTRTRDVIIEDNIIACLGEWKLRSDGRCNMALKTDESTDPTYAGTTYNITIRRNIVYSAATSPSFNDCCSGTNCNTCQGQACCGWFLEDVSWRTTCDPSKGYCSTSGGLIENNMIWNHITATSGECERGAICVTSNNDGIVVRNNTIYGGNRYGISLLGTNRNYAVYNNLVIGTGEEAIHTAAGYSAGSSITFNNTWRSSGNLYDGSIVKSCSQVSSFNSGNICSSTQFPKVSGDVATWNLHLLATDSANRQAGTQAPPYDDIDHDSRPVGKPIDIGADQAPSSADTTAPPPPTNVRFVW